jgi:sterol desaturase/sphingolipid hydroxylase (fatty acid hydroxylase superfamily)
LFGLTGAFCWSFAEYAIHNWVGHLGRGRNEFSREHLEHHRLGDYFAPTSKKAKAALPVLAALAAVLVPLLGGRPGGGFVLGFGLAYLAYEVLHRRLHTHPPRGPYGRWARRHHFYHHFMSPKRNHGVTSPLWDLVFGTYARPGVVRVPRRKAMRWLRPDEAAHARDYEVVGESPR